MSFFQRVPPLRVDDLIEDLKDGVRLIALLEVLANTKLVSSLTYRNLRDGPHPPQSGDCLIFSRKRRVTKDPVCIYTETMGDPLSYSLIKYQWEALALTSFLVLSTDSLRFCKCTRINVIFLSCCAYLASAPGEEQEYEESPFSE